MESHASYFRKQILFGKRLLFEHYFRKRTIFSKVNSVFSPGRKVSVIIRHMKETLDHFLPVFVNCCTASSRMDSKAPKEVLEGVSKSKSCPLQSLGLSWGNNSLLARDIVSWTLTGNRVNWMGVGKTGKQNKEDDFRTHRMEFVIEEESLANFCERHSLRWVNKR